MLLWLDRRDYPQPRGLVSGTDLASIEEDKMTSVRFMLVFIGCTLLGPKTEAQDRMTIEGNTLIFDTNAVWAATDDSPSIIDSDANLFGDLLMNNPAVDTVVISGSGGSLHAAYELARKLSQFDLTVIARNDCESGCSLMFMGGKIRKLEKGARLGFHRSATDAQSQRENYATLKESLGWADEFAYVRWAYEDGQIVAREYIEYLMQRGIKPEFALRVMAYSTQDMWYPTEKEMREAGVLTE